MVANIERSVKKRIMGLAPSVTLGEIAIIPKYSNVNPSDTDAVDLGIDIGPVHLNIPLLSAAMDTVTGPDMALALSELGGCGVIYRHRSAKQQLEWIEDALSRKWCMVSNPKCLTPADTLDEVQIILKKYGFSTIPIIDESNVLRGVLFTRDIVFKEHERDPVSKWMKPLESLKMESASTPFSKIRDRLLNEQECSVLPILNGGNRLVGMYFMKDVIHANPSEHNGKPLVGMAIGVHDEDCVRVKEALKMGVGMIVIDSSHGDCTAVIQQTARIKKIVGNKAALIAGNVADVDGGGFWRLAGAGADGVKVGIGSGSICTTPQQTGATLGMATALFAANAARDDLRIKRETIPRTLPAVAEKKTPKIIADGGINFPGDAVKAIACGAHAIMAGKWLAGARESQACVEYGVGRDGLIPYRGMASQEAIDERTSDRYGKKKTGAEGVSGFVAYRGPLKKWLPDDLSVMRSGFAHVDAASIGELRTHGMREDALTQFTAAGLEQSAVRVKQ